MKRRHFLRRAISAALCAALMAGLMVFPASAASYKFESEIKSYVSQVCATFGLEDGGKVNPDKVNATSPSSGKDLYVIQAYTPQQFNGTVFFSMVYEGEDGRVHYTQPVDFNDAVSGYLGIKYLNTFQANRTNAMSLLLPHRANRILGVYMYKMRNVQIIGPPPSTFVYSLNFDTLTISKATGPIEGVVETVSGDRLRSFPGSHVAYLSNVTEGTPLASGDQDGSMFRYTSQVQSGEASTALSTYALELVAGSDGYENRDGTVTVSYTDSLGLTYERSVRLREGYAAWQPSGEIDGRSIGYDYSLTTPWLDTSVKEMQGLASGYTGNFYHYLNNRGETCLRPYTATGIAMLMPENLDHINSITVALEEDDSLELQSVRLVELDNLSDFNYWNGGYSLERLRAWTGRVVAQSDGGPYTINGRSSVTFTANQGFSQRNLLTYSRGTGPYVDNTGDAVGVSVQLADVLGGGVESFLARDMGYMPFPAQHVLEKQTDEDASNAWGALVACRPELMTLAVQYRDTLGSVRQVSIPFTTTYLLYLLKENRGRLSGGSQETWISGILQQNETVALPIKLAEYDSLLSVRLTYGSAPETLAFYSSDTGDSQFYRQFYGAVDTATDTISVENICFYEGVSPSNFSSKYDTEKLACVFETSLTPAYSYSSSSVQGQQLSTGGTVSASVAEGSLTAGPARERDYSSKYLVRVKTADIETAGTTNPITISLGYTDSTGAQRTTTAYSIPELAANYYGISHRIYNYGNNFDQAELAPAEYQYERHMRRNCVCEFVVDLPDAASINSATLTIDGTNEWQMEYINIYRLTGLEQRHGERTVDGYRGTIYWRRDYTGTQVATARTSVLLYANSPSRTVNFTTYTEDGTPLEPEQATKTEDYLTSLPTSMTYNDTRKNLGLSIVKFTYQVDVEVADVEDAGSANYFYFQLVFENGTSGVVLANQQLSSDSFRQGMVESFLIKTTQNYGNVVSVRIICDNASSQSNVFDKLNIANITVTMKSDNGISKSWIVEKVGWIDITYTDEGADTGVEGLEQLTDAASSNVELVKEFAVSRQATAVDLLFCISTASSSASDSANPLENALQGKFEAILVYRDSSGMEKSQNFDLTAQIQDYNDTDKTFWLYRPNHVDRFTLSMPDITSVIALMITRTGGSATWVVDNVSIQQIGGLGDVYLSPTMTEYIRDTSNTSDLAVSTNDSGINYTISGSGNATITFTENSIDISSQEEQDAWNAAISRVPVLNSESLNIYLLPGGVIGQNYAFTTSSPPVRATVKYTTVYGGSLVQNSFTLGSLGELNGQTVLYGKNLEVSAMSSLSSLVLSSTAASGAQPYIGSAIVERSRGGVLMGTYYFNFGNYYLGNGNPEFSPTTAITPTPMHQLLRLQPASGQSAALTAETSDVAVALRYTSTLDPAGTKTVYQSPYVYLTDVGYTAITTGKFVDIPFELSNVDEVVGLAIATTGPVVSFDNALISNYAGPAAPGGSTGTDTASGADPGTDTGETPDTLLGTCSLSQAFTATTLPAVYTSAGQIVTPASFRFTTAPEEANAGAGTSGAVSMTVHYTDSVGGQASMLFDDLLSYLPAGSSPVPGSVIEIPLQLSDAAHLNSIVLSAEDSWLLSSVSAQLTLPDGTSSLSSTTVNNWARSTAPLTVDLLSPLYGGTGEGNQIQTFTVTGRGQNAQMAASASATVNSGGSLLVTAYEGDLVELTPVVSAVGKPDTTWSWNAGSYENSLSVRNDGSASFRVPGSMSPGDSCTFSVACNGDKRLAVSITIAVEAEPIPEPEPDSDAFGSGGGEGGEIDTPPAE